MKQQPILTVTVNPAVDKFASVDKVEPERKMRCSQPTFDCGGGGLNVSRAIRNLGGKTLASLMTGGPIGEIIEKSLTDEGIDFNSHAIKGWSRENLVIRETTTCHQFRFGMPGPHVSAAEWRAYLKAIARLKPGPAWAVLSGSLTPGVPVDFYAQLSTQLSKKGARVVVDTSGEPLRRLTRRGVHILKVNLRELSELVGKPLEGESQIARAAQKLIGVKASEAVVVTLNADGALLATRLQALHFSSPPVKVESVIGAGDSFVAGMVLTLARGHALEEAVRYGVASGTATVLTPGTQLCTLADTRRMLPKVLVRPVKA